MPVSRADLATTTFTQYAVGTATRLLSSVGLDTERGASALRRMLDGWGDRPIGTQPTWRSDVCADGSPLEFSAAFSGEGATEVRVLLEAVPTEPSSSAAQGAAARVTRALEPHAGVVTDRLREVGDLFFPKANPRGFALMHAVIFSEGKVPEFKVYLNPRADDRMAATDRVRAALGRLGFAEGWEAVRAYARRGFDLDQIVYFGFDLTDHPGSRVKVYFRHYDITAARLDAAMGLATGHRAGGFEGFVQTLTGRAGVIGPQPPVSNLTFMNRTGVEPHSATSYVPLWTYSDSDEAIRDRIVAALCTAGIPEGPYLSLLGLVAGRPLSEGRGIHTYASLHTQRTGPRITVYWSSELYDRYPAARYQRS